MYLCSGEEATVLLKNALSPGVTYTARIYADEVNSPLRTAYRIEERQVTSADSLRIEMAADGGCAVTFEPTNKPNA